jgi:hypothetical protein
VSKGAGEQKRDGALGHWGKKLKKELIFVLISHPLDFFCEIKTKIFVLI